MSYRNRRRRYHMNYSSGSGFLSLLQILFIGLKLTGHITWSWWWVLSPTWISASIGIVFLILIGLLFIFMIKDETL